MIQTQLDRTEELAAIAWGAMDMHFEKLSRIVNAETPATGDDYEMLRMIALVALGELSYRRGVKRDNANKPG